MIFYHWWYFNWGGAGPPGPPLATPMRLLTMLLPGWIYIALDPWHFGDFRNVFPPNIVEDQKKSYDFRSGPLASTASYYGKSGPD